MNNNQLTLLLNGLLAELDTVIDAMRDAMPEGAERLQCVEFQLKPEYYGLSGAVQAMNKPISETHNEITVDGEYTAIAPLVALRDAWADRFEVLEGDEDA